MSRLSPYRHSPYGHLDEQHIIESKKLGAELRLQWEKRGFLKYGLTITEIEYPAIVWIGNKLNPVTQEVSVLARIKGLGYEEESSEKVPKHWFVGALALKVLREEEIENDPFAIAYRALAADVLCYHPTGFDDSFNFLRMLLPTDRLTQRVSEDIRLQPTL